MGRILIIGAITRDTLIYLENDNKCRIINGFGGILHIIKSFSVLAKYFPKLKDIEILPIANVGYDIYNEVLKEIKSLDGNINLVGLRKIQKKNIHSYILFASEYGTQYDDNLEEPVTYEQVLPYLQGVDFVIVSPMTGFDVDKNVLIEIKRNNVAPLYFDYHILSLDRGRLGNRYLKRRDDWRDWCTNCDHLQLNKFEAELLFDVEIQINTDFIALTKPLLESEVKSIAITLGSKGSVVCYEEKDKYKQEFIEADNYNNIVNTTSCGDVYASGFIPYLIEHGNLLNAYKFASKIASLRTQVKDAKDLTSFDKRIRKILGAVA